MHFYKYHGIGNDYLVLDPANLPAPLNQRLQAAWVRAICDRARGVGSDGIVYGPLPAGTEAGAHRFACQVWNPDGSEAEVSGNGLRIFARFLIDAGYLPNPATLSGLSCVLYSGGRSVGITYGRTLDAPIEVELGAATVRMLPDLMLPAEQASGIDRLGQPWTVNVGNPHCVFFLTPDLPLDRALVQHWGPLVENAPPFSARTNVQFARLVDRHHLAIEIWERGAGYTLASGSSSCAAAAAAVAAGQCQSPVTVSMPGGVLHVRVDRSGSEWHVALRGPVTPIYSGDFSPDWLQSL